MPIADDVVDRHLAELRQRGLSQGTIYARRRAIARMSQLIDVPLLEATGEDLARWRDGLAVIDNTVVHYASHARSFFGWCERKGLIGRNPCDDLIVPVLVRGLPRPVGEDDLMLAVTEAPPRIRPWLVLAGWAGLRAKEVALLRRECILDARRPPVLLVARDATKGRRERIVPMCSFVRRELRLAGLPSCGYVFRRLDGRPGPNNPAVISHVANRYLRELGLDVTFHQFRHSFATGAYWLSRDLRRVQDWLGHADPASTTVYTGYCQDDGAELLEGLPVPALLRAVGELWTGGRRSTLNRKGGLTCDDRRFTRNGAQFGRAQALRVRVREAARSRRAALPPGVREPVHAGMAGRRGRVGHGAAPDHGRRMGGDRAGPRSAPGPRQDQARDHAR